MAERPFGWRCRCSKAFAPAASIYRANSAFAADRFKALRAKLDRGDTLYLGGICASGTHNSGVALVEVTRERGPKLICNNEEERFSGERHTTKFPDQSIDELAAMLRRAGLRARAHRCLVLRLGQPRASSP